MGSQGRNWNSKKVIELRKNLKFSKFQKDVLVGKILGDASLVATITGKSYRLQVEQGIRQEKYVFWLAEIFQKWIISQPKFMKKHNSYRFRTISHPQISEFRKIFYPNRKKIIPSDINKLLNHPIGLAVWFMDDGGLSTSGRAITISTHSFTKTENNLLIECLNANFGLKVNLNWDGKGFRLYFPVKEIPKFRKIVSSYILPEMKYKIPLTP